MAAGEMGVEEPMTSGMCQPETNGIWEREPSSRALYIAEAKRVCHCMAWYAWPWWLSAGVGKKTLSVKVPGCRAEMM
jgi:hypothetical protein